MATYIVKSGQSIYDGDLMGVSNILVDNPTIDLETYLVEDSTLEIFPTAETIIRSGIASFFKNKTITGAETAAGVEVLDVAVSFGELITKNLGGDTYVNDFMWGNGAINLSNTGVLLDEFNFDRIKITPTPSLIDDNDFFEMDFTYNDLGLDVEQTLIGSELGTEVRILNGNISLYYLGEGGLPLTHSTLLLDGRKYRLKVELSDDSVGRVFNVSIDGYVNVSTNTTNEIRFNLIGGQDGSGGYEGAISYINANTNVFNFFEGSGTHIYKTK